MLVHANSDNRLSLGADWLIFCLSHVLWAVLFTYQSLKCCAHFHAGRVDQSILPDEELVVINTHEHDDEDLESFFGVSSSNPARTRLHWNCTLKPCCACRAAMTLRT